jgi:hypothetical protein
MKNADILDVTPRAFVKPIASIIRVIRTGEH